MIIKNDYLDRKDNYLQEEKKGLLKAIKSLDKRYKDGNISKENFLKQNEIFAKKHKKINKEIEKNERRK